MRWRVRQILLVTSMLWTSWLTMTLVHESGHALGALCTGGRVQRVVWHPAVISRTDVHPNPHPLAEVSAGPLIGILFPLACAGLASAVRLRIAYLIWVIAGFCLIANGAYIGIGSIWPAGDAAELLAHGMPPWVMTLFGILATTCGLWIWHRVSPKLGFGTSPEPISSKHAYISFLLALLSTAVGVAFGNRGI